MITKITKTDFLKFAGRIISGIFANPTSGNIATDPYARQQIISQTIQDATNAFMSSGIEIVDQDEKLNP